MEQRRGKREGEDEWKDEEERGWGGGKATFEMERKAMRSNPRGKREEGEGWKEASFSPPTSPQAGANVTLNPCLDGSFVSIALALLSPPHADRSIRVLVHADQPPSDSCSVHLTVPLRCPSLPLEKGEMPDVDRRGRQRPPPWKKSEERKTKKTRKKTENDPNCKRRMGRCSSDVDVRGRTKAKHEW